MLVFHYTSIIHDLFSKLYFFVAIQDLSEEESAAFLTFRYEFSREEDIRVRAFRAELVKAKLHEDTILIAKRILDMDINVLVVQEVEDIYVMNSFNKEYLQNLHPHQVLIEGHAPRFIDVALFSKLPLGAVTGF